MMHVWACIQLGSTDITPLKLPCTLKLHVLAECGSWCEGNAACSWFGRAGVGAPSDTSMHVLGGDRNSGRKMKGKCRTSLEKEERPLLHISSSDILQFPWEPQGGGLPPNQRPGMVSHQGCLWVAREATRVSFKVTLLTALIKAPSLGQARVDIYKVRDGGFKSLQPSELEKIYMVLLGFGLL